MSDTASASRLHGVREIARSVRSGETSAVAVAEDALIRAGLAQDAYNCFAEIAVDSVLRQAADVDAKVASGQNPGRMTGTVVAVKDITPVAGMGNRAGSPSRASVIADKSAVVVQRMQAEGAVIVGKTTLPEFAFSSFCDSPLYGITRNPWDPTRTPGGSSGGSAVAVSTGSAMIGEGTDMGGSIRIPASFTGVVGIKPSFGRIPNDDMPSLFDDIQHHGLLGRSVDDIALALECVSGRHPSDPQSEIAPMPTIDLDSPLDGLSVAFSIDLDSFAVADEVASRMRDVAEVLARAGARIDEVTTGITREMRSGWVDHWHVYLAGHFGEEVDDRSDPRLRAHIARGRTLSATHLLQLDALRSQLWRALLENVWRRHDLLLTPTMTRPAVAVGDDDEQYREGGLDMTSVFNWTPWSPAVSVPAGLSAEGLPIGAQIVARPYRDNLALVAARAIERHFGVLSPPSPHREAGRRP